ncbi:hypothetical protein OS493_037512 [Desmophyllum pertusum]|uniref:Uncharacterized protein n=1 Tax=Desmophyllum pertusum TaxID=174260 RepID=A0A9W9Y750_9CNID|nr:hypothetical protein OS493_037512 [Desmophyllum pertusum]
MENTETQIVAKAFNAKIVKFNNLEEMQTSLRKGIIGRVLVDRNTAYHFLDKSGLKGNRQFRLIRNIDYPMDYFLAHVNREVVPTTSTTADMLDQMDGLFSTGSEMTRFILFTLLAVFLVLIIIGILWEVYTKCNTAVLNRRKDTPHRQHGAYKDNLVPLNRKMYTMHNFLDMEKRLIELTADVHNMKE